MKRNELQNRHTLGRSTLAFIIYPFANMSMSRTLFAATLLVIFVSPLLAGDIYRGIDAGNIVVATITKVEDKGATNVHPPRVWLKVDEVILGDAKVNRSPAIWSPPWHGVDWGGDGNELIAKWKAKPFKGPKVGEKYILSGRLVEEVYREKDSPAYDLFEVVRIPYSATARANILAELAAMKEARRKATEQHEKAEKEPGAKR